MATIHTLSETEAIEQIVETVQQAEPGTAPFALVIGSGFSHGLVPTVRELIGEGFPLWVKSLDGKESFEALSMSPVDQRNSIARSFWQNFVTQNTSRRLVLPLDSQTGLPENPAEAYMAIFNPGYFGALGAPAQARKFQRAFMQLEQPRLNAAHFLLASLLGVQPGKKRESQLFKARAAFSRLILTTNFDPFLQIALQAVNRLYFMSDTPGLGVSDEIFDDQTDAIHLVYLHGSIHRRSQAATDEDIKKLKKQNARTLAPVLRCRGVIVLGYSGWDDTIVEALAACDSFDHRLYWCGREADPLAKGAFGPSVPDILQKSTSIYVQIESAGRFMAQLCNHLVEGIPRLLDNPIGQLREMLEMIDLKELEPVMPPTSTDSHNLQQPNIQPDPSAFIESQKATIMRLVQAERNFFSPTTIAMQKTAKLFQSDQVKFPEQPVSLQSQAERQLLSAQVAEALGNYEESLKICTDILVLNSLQPNAKAETLIIRGRAFYFLQKIDKAVEDWTTAIETPNISIESVAKALFNRGTIWGQKGNTDRAIYDYSQLIDLPNVTVELLARSLLNRGFAWNQKGKRDKAMQDYTQVIDLPETPIKLVGKALLNRSFIWSEMDEIDKELQDYSRLIDLNNGPVELVAQALLNRGFAWSQKNDMDRAIQDYSQLIELYKAPSGLVAQALGNRGWIYYQQKDYRAFLADTEMALSKDPKLDFAAFNLGLALLVREHDAEAFAAYSQAAEQFPEKIKTLGIPDILEAQKSWLTEERARPVLTMLESYQT